MKKDGAVGKEFTKEGSIGELCLALLTLKYSETHIHMLNYCTFTSASQNCSHACLGGTVQKGAEKAQGAGQKMKGEAKQDK